MHVYRAALHVYRAATPSPHVSGVVYKTMRRCLTNKLPYWIRWSRSIVPRRRSRVSTLPPHTLRQPPPPPDIVMDFMDQPNLPPSTHTDYNTTWRADVYTLCRFISHTAFISLVLFVFEISPTCFVYFLFRNTFLEFPYINIKPQTYFCCWGILQCTAKASIKLKCWQSYHNDPLKHTTF